jgi:hypothetical protein
MRSILAILRSGSHGRNHLAFLTAEVSWLEHNLPEQWA